MKRLRVTLRPVGRGNWRPLVLEVIGLPRERGYLFAKDDSELDLVERRDEWVIGGRPYRVTKVEERPW